MEAIKAPRLGRESVSAVCVDGRCIRTRSSQPPWVLRRAARERGGPLPSIDVADALLDERRKLMSGLKAAAGIFTIRD